MIVKYRNYLFVSSIEINNMDFLRAQNNYVRYNSPMKACRTRLCHRQLHLHTVRNGNGPDWT